MDKSLNESTSKTLLKVLFALFAFIIVLFLLVPVAFVIIWSFTGKDGLVSLTSDFTLKWFHQVFSSKEWLRAISVSVLYAMFSTLISLILVIVYYYYSLWYKKSYRYLGHIIISIPLFFPLLVYALALKMVSAKFAIPEALGIVLGHVSILIPLQYFILDGSNEKLKMDWLYSSTVMGASHGEIVRKILLPNIRITLLVALGCGFLYSFDETIISNFLIDSRNVTIPKKIWLEIDRNISPSSGVVYTTLLLINIPIILLLVFYKKIKTTASMKIFRILKTFMFRDVKATIKSASIAAIIAFGFEFLIFQHVSFTSLLATFIIAILLFIILEFIFQLLSWGYQVIDIVYSYRKEGHSRYKNLAIALLSNRIETVTHQLNDFFQNPNGVSLTFAEAAEVTELLFSNNKGFYFGTDSNVPSRFREFYPTYLLNSQECKTSARILLCSREELENDFVNNNKAFADFYDWHSRNGVYLLAIDKIQVYHIFSTIPNDKTDIGIWDDDYVVIFKPTDVSNINVWFKSYNTLGETKKYVKFFNSLILDDNIKQLKINNNHLTFLQLQASNKNEIIGQLKRLWKIQ